MLPVREQDRRRFGRIDLEEPLPALVGDVKAEVVDVSVGGFRILHEARFPQNDAREIRFSWNGHDMRFACHIVRSTLFRLAKAAGEKTLFQSGARIDEPFGDSETVLRSLIAERVTQALAEQKANAYGLPPVGSYTYQVGKGDRYRRCELTEGRWRKFDTNRAEQPAEGFTISADVDPRHVDLLCGTYEQTTAEGRRLTRMLAELSIRKSEGGPTRKYVP